MGFQSKLAQRIGRLQPKQPTANHHPTPGIFRFFRNGIEIVERTVNKTIRGITAFYRRHKRVRSGGQHQRIPVGFMAAGGTDNPSFTVDFRHTLRKTQLDTVTRKEVLVHQ